MLGNRTTIATWQTREIGTSQHTQLVNSVIPSRVISWVTPVQPCVWSQRFLLPLALTSLSQRQSWGLWSSLTARVLGKVLVLSYYSTNLIFPVSCKGHVFQIAVRSNTVNLSSDDALHHQAGATDLSSGHERRPAFKPANQLASNFWICSFVLEVNAGGGLGLQGLTRGVEYVAVYDAQRDCWVSTETGGRPQPLPRSNHRCRSLKLLLYLHHHRLGLGVISSTLATGAAEMQRIPY